MDQRIPKKLLLEQGAPTATDRRLIQDGVETLTWVAALKPATVGVPSYSDEAHDYPEIAVVAAELRPAARAARLVELLHRAIPYPLVLVTAQEGGVSLSLAHKRRSEGETGRVVLEGVEATAPMRPEVPTLREEAFLASLALASQPRRDLHALYEGWIGCVTALAAARITGRYAPPTSREQTVARRAALDEIQRLRRAADRLRVEARKERQLDRRVELNMEIRRLDGRIQQLQAEL